MAKKTEVQKIEAEIEAIKNRHDLELAPLRERLTAALVVECKIEFKIDIGSIIEYKGKRNQITGFSVGNFNCYPIATEFKKDGKLGLKKNRIYSFERIVVIKK